MCVFFSFLFEGVDFGFPCLYANGDFINIDKQSGIGNWAPESLQKSSQVNFLSKPFHSIHTNRELQNIHISLQLNKRFNIQLCTGFIGLDTNQIM